MKTALEILIENLYLLKRNSMSSDSNRGGDYRIGLSQAIVEAKALLETEKQQIIDAYSDGETIVYDAMKDLYNMKGDYEKVCKESANNYYTQTFKDK